MKNMIIIVILLSMIIGFIMPQTSYAVEPKDKVLEDVILKVKGLFEISNEYDKFVSRVNSNNEETYFHLSWTDTKEILPEISISTDSKGNINSFNKYIIDKEESPNKLPDIKQEEALGIAFEFIKKVEPKILEELKLKENNDLITTWDRNYNFIFSRVIDGIPYNENTLNISVNKFSGEVANYYVNWERNLEFPKVEGIISLEKAKENYINKIGLKLIYKSKNRYLRPMDNSTENKYYLAYSTLGDKKGIDAKTGDAIDITNYIIYARGLSKEKMVDEAAGASPIITPEERKEIDKLVGIKDIKEVEAKGRKILNIEEGFKLESYNLYTSWQEQDSFYFTLSFKNENKSIQISLDAKTLDLLNFYKNADIDANAKPTIGNNEALELANAFVKKMNFEKYNQIELLENKAKDNEKYYNFNFIRKIDDIYVENDGISIGVDAVNKDINSYSIIWYKGDFPSSENTISIDKAYEVLFNKMDFTLNYIPVPKENINDKKEVKLVYSVSNDKPNIIDAKSGEILDNLGNPYKENKTQEYIDIDKSYAKHKIKTLSLYGISFKSEEFKPKDKIVQKDFLYLLWKSLNPYRSDIETDTDAIYKDLKRQGIIKKDEENINGYVSKEEAMLFVIRALKYDKLADIKGIYKDVFKDYKDITEDLKGYIALGYGLKIINGDGTGNLRPKYELKREDAANIIYNYMFN